jgi:hypothetical protein
LGVFCSGERTPCAAALINPRRVGSARSSKFVPLYIKTRTGSFDVAEKRAAFGVERDGV